tara:strand:+ start:1170 stop:1349 length:180 start_codon:yes stop_codon:yes gene_type:complete
LKECLEEVEMMLETALILTAIPFVALTLFFGTKGGFYDSDDYDGHGTAHKVLIDDETSI